MKLAVVGGGSTYTPELVDGLARLGDVLPVDELVLLDPDSDRLDVVGGFAQRILTARGATTRLTLTTDRDAAIDSASAVLLQLRVGGQQARAGDETFPLACGCVGQETTGAGGLAKALRTVPVVLNIAETVRRRAAADAWIVDFTNPVGIVTRALLQEGHRAVGLCNVAIGFQRMFASWLGVAPDAVGLDHVGLNHLTWIRRVDVDGHDVLPQLLAAHGDELAERLELPRSILDRLGAVPSYYLRYYYAHDEVVRELLARGTRAEEVQRIEAELLEMYRDPALVAKPALLEQRGGAYYSEAAVALIASLLGGEDHAAVHVANVRNDGHLPFLADDAVVEVPCHVSPGGIHARPTDPVEPLYAGLIAHVSAYEDLALRAAVHGGRDRVADALLAHPLVGQYDVAETLTDALIAGNRQHLPWAR
ncbi:MAG TPA: 6-phospho-beta-glucosidase [Candidatus Nanopelagicales bacterium]|nr:6-phospho-beta-glucosidase [Candidatus Nanopelagicales bacterium]